MIKKLTCIDCPKGCVLSIEIESGKVVKVTGNLCPKGIPYATCEIENPMRILTSTVLTNGLSIKMIPVRTDKPIPKPRLLDAMKEIRKLKLDKPVHVGDVLVSNFLSLGVNLISTRDCS
jgi:CxxC motif-containing protein